MGKYLKPGEKAPVSGQYNVLGPIGGKKGAEITAVKGRRLPPSQIGTQYELVDKTKHSKK